MNNGHGRVRYSDLLVALTPEAIAARMAALPRVDHNDRPHYCCFCGDHCHGPRECPLVYCIPVKLLILNQKGRCGKCLNRHRGVCTAKGFCRSCDEAGRPTLFSHNEALCPYVYTNCYYCYHFMNMTRHP